MKDPEPPIPFENVLDACWGEHDMSSTSEVTSIYGNAPDDTVVQTIKINRQTLSLKASELRLIETELKKQIMDKMVGSSDCQGQKIEYPAAESKFENMAGDALRNHSDFTSDGTDDTEIWVAPIKNDINTIQDSVKKRLQDSVKKRLKTKRARFPDPMFALTWIFVHSFVVQFAHKTKKRKKGPIADHLGNLFYEYLAFFWIDGAYETRAVYKCYTKKDYYNRSLWESNYNDDGYLVLSRKGKRKAANDDDNHLLTLSAPPKKPKNGKIPAPDHEAADGSVVGQSEDEEEHEEGTKTPLFAKTVPSKAGGQQTTPSSDSTVSLVSPSEGINMHGGADDFTKHTDADREAKERAVLEKDEHFNNLQNQQLGNAFKSFLEYHRPRNNSVGDKARLDKVEEQYNYLLNRKKSDKARLDKVEEQCNKLYDVSHGNCLASTGNTTKIHQLQNDWQNDVANIHKLQNDFNNLEKICHKLLTGFNALKTENEGLRKEVARLKSHEAKVKKFANLLNNQE